MVSSKKVTLSVLSQEQSEGVGARVRRSIGRPEVCWFGGCFVLFCRRDWWDTKGKLGNRGPKTIMHCFVGYQRSQV